MFIVCVIVTVLIAFIAFTSAMGLLQGVPQLREILADVGFAGHMRMLGLLQLAGAVGLIVGLFVAPIGIAAGAGLTLYYLGAMLAHVKAGDARQQVFVPFPLALFALAATILRLVTM
ncbi:MAG: DoxX family protein [Ilumatobacteraceae bacterium]